MAGINPIGGAGGVGGVGPMTPATGAAKSRPASSPNFDDALQTYMRNVNADQHASTQAVQDLLSGKTDDVLPAVTAMAEADMSFKLLVGVRNKMIEAYKQTLNMQV